MFWAPTTGEDVQPAFPPRPSPGPAVPPWWATDAWVTSPRTNTGRGSRGRPGRHQALGTGLSETEQLGHKDWGRIMCSPQGEGRVPERILFLLKLTQQRLNRGTSRGEESQSLRNSGPCKAMPGGTNPSGVVLTHF